MTRWGLRVGPKYPFARYIGDVIRFGNSTREQVEQIRGQMATGVFHDVIQLDDRGDPVHEIVTTRDGIDGTQLHYCIRCSATSHGIHKPAGVCPGVTG